MIPASRISGELAKIDEFLGYRRVQTAIRDPEYRRTVFRGLRHFRSAEQYYIALDETGKEISKVAGNNRKLWWLKEVSQRCESLSLLLEGNTRVSEEKDVGFFEYGAEEVVVDDIRIRCVQLLRYILRRVDDTFDNMTPPISIYDVIHLLAHSDSGDPIETKVGSAGWTNGYTWEEIDDVFAEHDNPKARNSHEKMTMSALWTHSMLHQEASKMTDGQMSESLQSIRSPLRFSMAAQVGGRRQIEEGLRPVFFDQGHQYQLSRSFGDSGEKVSFEDEEPVRDQIIKAREEIVLMIKNGPAMYGSIDTK